MNSFKIIPLSEAYAAEIKISQKDYYGNVLLEEIATGYGPCRISLTPFKPGEDTRILFSHSPFEIKNAFDQPGPVFIHKKEVRAYNDVHRFPPAIKADKKHFPLTLIGYNRVQKMIFTQLVGDLDVDVLIEQVFKEQEEVEFLHARNAEAGCFICRIERV
jgi:hypothetical protein